MVSSAIQVLVITDNDHEHLFINDFPEEVIIKSQKIDQIFQAVKKLNPQLILLCLNENKKQTSKLCNNLKSSDLTRNIPLLSIPEFENAVSKKGEIVQIENSPLFSPNITSQSDFINLLSKFIRQTQFLQKNEAILSQFFSHSPVYIFIKKISPTSNQIIYASDFLSDLIGIPGNQLIGKSLDEIIDPLDAKQIMATEWDIIQRGDVKYEENKHNGKYYITIKFPLWIENETYLGGFTFDITEQKKIEEALRVSEAHFRSIVDNSDAGYFFIDKDGIIRDVNLAWVKLYKYDSADEVVGHHFMEIQRVDDKQVALEFVDGIMRNDPNYLKGEFSRLCKDGSIGYHSFSARPVNRENEVTGIEGFIIDITERREAVEALRRSEERYHLIDEASQDLIYSYDLNSRFTHVNRYLCEIFQITPEQIIGKNHEEVGFRADLRNKWAELHQRVIDTNATVTGESILTLPDGTERHVDVKLNPMHDCEGNIIGIAGISRDIHEQKLADAKIKEQMLELRQWHTITMGREERILDLKREINQLLEEAGKPPKYKSVGKEKPDHTEN